MAKLADSLRAEKRKLIGIRFRTPYVFWAAISNPWNSRFISHVRQRVLRLKCYFRRLRMDESASVTASTKIGGMVAIRDFSRCFATART